MNNGGLFMKKIFLSTILGFTLFNFNASNLSITSPVALEEMAMVGVTSQAPDGFPYVQSANDLYSFYANLKMHDMVKVDTAANSAFIGGYVFLDNFTYEYDIAGIIATIVQLCLSTNKLSSAKAKIAEWEHNLIKNLHNEELYKNEEYIMFVKTFAEVFFKTHARDLASFDSVEFELKLIYVDESNCLKRAFGKLANCVALASDKITSIQELFVKNSFIKGKYKFSTNKSGTEINLVPIE